MPICKLKPSKKAPAEKGWVVWQKIGGSWIDMGWIENMPKADADKIAKAAFGKYKLVREI